MFQHAKRPRARKDPWSKTTDGTDGTAQPAAQPIVRARPNLQDLGATADYVESFLRVDERVGESGAERGDLIAANTHAEIEEELSYLAGLAEEAEGGGAADSQFGGAVKQLIMRHQAELSTELEHDVVLSSASPATPWSVADLAQLGESLDRMPEALYGDHEGLGELVRAGVYGPNATRAADTDDETGDITFYDAAFLDPVGPQARPDAVQLTGERSELAGIESVGVLDEVLAHELGHVEALDHPGAQSMIGILGGWLTGLGSEDVTGALEDQNFSESIIEGAMDDLGHGHEIVDREGVTYRSDRYSDEEDAYVSRDPGYIPGSTPDEAERWAYATAHPAEHFAELVSNMALAPELTYQDLVAGPRERLAEAALDGADEDEIDRLRSEAESMGSQWSTARSQVFGVTPELEQETLGSFASEINWEDPVQAVIGNSLLMDLNRDLERAATPEQLERLEERYRRRLHEPG